MSNLIHRAAFFFFTLAVFGLYLTEYAKVVPSLAMIGLILCGVVLFMKNKKLPDMEKDFVVLASGFVLLYAIQFFTSDNYTYLLERIKIKLPFIFLPLSLLLIPPFSKQNLTRLALAFIAITTATALYITLKFLFNYEVYIELIKQSQIVRGPINHIRFSLMVVTAIAICYFLVFDQGIRFHPIIRKAMIGVMIFLILFIHFYTVRSGIIALYAIMFYFMIRKLTRQSSMKQWVIYISLFIAAPFIAYFSSQSIQSKVKATLNDISNYQSAESNEFNSLGKRMVSYQVAFEVFKESPVTGCGIGDLEDVNREMFHKNHPDIATIIIPHNQFIYYLMGSGLLGILIFGFTFFYPLFHQGNYKNSLLTAQYIILFLSMQTEPMLENQLGVAYSVLFIIFPLLWIRSGHAEAASV